MKEGAEDFQPYKTVINHEEQYSIWPPDKAVPEGWGDNERRPRMPAVAALNLRGLSAQKPSLLTLVEFDSSRSKNDAGTFPEGNFMHDTCFESAGMSAPVRKMKGVSMLKRIIGCIVVLRLVSLCLFAAPNIKAIILTGQAVPGLSGTYFSFVGLPSINGVGAVAFKGGLVGATVGSGIFVVSGSNISRVVVSGTTGAKLDLPFSNFGDPVVNDKGDVAFKARLGPGLDKYGVFFQTSAGLIPIVLTGDLAPATAGKFTHVGQYGVVLNNSGKIAFQASYDGLQSGAGIFEYSNGQVRPIAVTGQPAPGGAGALYDQFFDLSMNESGQVAFAASLSKGSGATGIFIADAKGVRTVALQGQQARYTQGGTLGRLSQPWINDAGDVTFVDSTTIGARSTLSVPKGVMLHTSGITTVLATKGTQAGVSALHLSGNFQRPVIIRGDRGTNHVAFMAWGKNRGRSALLVSSNNGVAQILQEGDAAAGGGVHSFIGNLTVARSGHFAFVSNLEGSAAKAGIFIGTMSF
jgi:hypothetical protein